MGLRRIVYYPEEVLRRPSSRVDEITDEIAQLMDDMAETMYASSGIGLAAPQVGVGLRVITVDVGPRENGAVTSLLQLANPEVIEGSGRVLFEEGCLSFPGLTVEVPRYTNVRVRALNRQGQSVDIEATDLLAICLQHEIDHIDGITFVDRLKGLKRLLALRQWRRLARDLAADRAAA